jgi:predicted MFS family arabinose efflux permease
MTLNVPVRTDWLRVLLLWLAGLGAAAQYGKVSVIFDRMSEMYPDAGALLGWAVSLVGLVGILLGVTAGIFVARFSLRRAMIWGLWLGAGMSFVQALSPSLPVFMISRAAEGLSHLALVVAAPTLIAGASSARDQSLTLTLWSTFFGVAFALLAWFGLPLAARFGVPALFLAHAVFMAVCAVLLGRLLRPDAKRTAPSGRIDLLARHKRIYRSPVLSAPAAGWLFYTFCFVSLLTLLPPYLDPAQRALIIGAMPLVSILGSMTLGVWLLRLLSPIAVVQIGFLGAAACAAVMSLMPGTAVLCLLIAALLGLVQGASFAAVPYLADTAETRALANGAMAQAGNIGNTLGTPVLFYVATTGGYRAMMLTLAAVLLAGFAAHCVFWLRRRRLAPI